MTTLTRVQPDTGAMAMETSLTSIPAQRRMTDEDLSAFAEGSGLNGPFLAKLLSACLAHENDGVNLYRALDAVTSNPALKPVFKVFREESAAGAKAYATLIAALGGKPLFASPIAHVTEAIDNKLVEALGTSAGSTEAAILDLKGIEVAMLASYVCVNNCELLQSAAQEASPGEAKDAMEQAVAEIGPVARAHLEWNRDTLHKLINVQARSETAEKAILAAQKVVSKVKDALH